MGGPRAETNKDAADLYRLMISDADAGNSDRIYDQELDLPEAAGFDMRLAGAGLPGRDVAAICDTRTLHVCRGCAFRGTNSNGFPQRTSM
jgi:predicted nucleotidyltransferase